MSCLGVGEARGLDNPLPVAFAFDAEAEIPVVIDAMMGLIVWASEQAPRRSSR